MNVMPIRELIDEVTEVCKANILIVIRRFAKVFRIQKKAGQQIRRQTFQNGIIDDDGWMQMLKDRNQLAHDYDGMSVFQQ